MLSKALCKFHFAVKFSELNQQNSHELLKFTAFYHCEEYNSESRNRVLFICMVFI